MSKTNPIQFQLWSVSYSKDGEPRYFTGTEPAFQKQDTPREELARIACEVKGIPKEDITAITAIGLQAFRGKRRAVEMLSYEWDGKKWDIPLAELPV